MNKVLQTHFYNAFMVSLLHRVHSRSAPFPHRVTAATSGEGMYGYTPRDTTELHLLLV